MCKEHLLVEDKAEEGHTIRNFATGQLRNGNVVQNGMSVLEIIKKRTSSNDDQDAFYVADLSDVEDKYYGFRRELPRVKPFYAVKCNNSEEVLQTLAVLGTGFDCASKAEIDLVLNLGVPADDIVYANTCKQPAHLRHAAKHGVCRMTFDCESELQKVARNHPTAQMILRIVADETLSWSSSNKKFGAPLQKCEDLLKLAKNLNLPVIGVSFHVGTKSRNLQAFYQGIADARHVFDLGRKLGHVMTVLDIGGGYPGTYDFQPGFKEFAAVINEALDRYFPGTEGVEIIAEPGRYFVGSAFTAVLNIIGKKEDYVADIDGKQVRKLSYYLNDGIFGTFRSCEIDKEALKPKLLKDYHLSHKHFPSTIWGPCCTDQDLILEEVSLPELDIGDWIMFPNMGAYSLAKTSRFNGFYPPTVYYTLSNPKRGEA